MSPTTIPGNLILRNTSVAPPLLNYYPGAAAAYSLRSLTVDDISVVRVRRSSDNAESDFTATEVSDGTLAAWVGAGNDGFVRTWYDQSGNNRNVGQTTTTYQPLIVSSGSIITDDTSRPSILYATDFLRYAGNMSIAQPITLVCVNSANIASVPSLSYITDNTSRLILGTSQADRYGYHPGSAFATATASINTNTTVINFVYFNGTSSSMYIDGNLAATGGSGSAGISTFFTIGNRFDAAASNSWPGYVPELIIYPSDQSANRTGIEANINAHYSIYP